MDALVADGVGAVKGFDSLGDNDDQGSSDQDSHANGRDQSELRRREGKSERQGTDNE